MRELDGSPIKISRLYGEDGYIAMLGFKPAGIAEHRDGRWTVTVGDRQWTGFTNGPAAVAFMHGLFMDHGQAEVRVNFPPTPEK